MLLGKLPPGTKQFVFADLATVGIRPQFQSEVERRLARLTIVTGGVIGPELIRAAEINAAAVGFNREAGSDREAAILRGDFQQFPVALREAAAAPIADLLEIEQLRNLRVDLLEIDVLETFRGVTIFSFLSEVRPPLLVAVPDLSTLVLAHVAEQVKEIIDRHLDGGEVPQPLSEALSSLGSADFLYTLEFESKGSQSPLFSAAFVTWAVSLEKGATSTIRVRLQFDKEDQASEASARLQDQGDLSSLFWRYNKKPVGQVRQDGRAVLAEVTVPDQDVVDLLQGD